MNSLLELAHKWEIEAKHYASDGKALILERCARELRHELDREQIRRNGEEGRRMHDQIAKDEAARRHEIESVLMRFRCPKCDGKDYVRIGETVICATAALGTVEELLNNPGCGWKSEQPVENV